MWKIYLGIGGVSLCLIAMHVVCEPSSWRLHLSAIGDSGICAVIVAYIIDRWQKRERDRRASSFLDPYRKEIIFVLERILWLDEHLEDDKFDWNLAELDYWRVEFIEKMGDGLFGRELGGSEAMKWLAEVQNKYMLDSLTKKSEEVRCRVNRLFKIVAVGSPKLLMLRNDLARNKMILESEGIFPREKSESLVEKLEFIHKNMVNENGQCKNYGVIITVAIEALKLLGDNPIERVGLTPCLFSDICTELL